MKHPLSKFCTSLSDNSNHSSYTGIIHLALSLPPGAANVSRGSGGTRSHTLLESGCCVLHIYRWSPGSQSRVSEGAVVQVSTVLTAHSSTRMPQPIICPDPVLTKVSKNSSSGDLECLFTISGWSKQIFPSSELRLFHISYNANAAAVVSKMWSWGNMAAPLERARDKASACVCRKSWNASELCFKEKKP